MAPCCLEHNGLSTRYLDVVNTLAYHGCQLLTVMLELHLAIECGLDQTQLSRLSDLGKLE